MLRIDRDSKLAHILGQETIATNTRHHQAVRKPGRGVQVTAWAEDGIVEAIELPAYPFAIGVQSHPESLTEKAVPAWRKLFEAFVAAAQTRTAMPPPSRQPALASATPVR